MSFVYWIPLLIGCATVPSPVPVAGADAATVRASDVGPPPVSFVPLEERVNVLIAEAQETDRRDRLIAARDLMQTMRNKDPIAQRKVFEYLDAVLKIEERNSAAPIGMEPIGTLIEEEPLGVPALVAPPAPVAPSAPATAPVPVAPLAAADPAAILATARVALADARYLDAVALLDSLTTPDAVALRKEAVDAWARTERERAGHLFLEARQLPPGGERVASLRAARSALAAINERFPGNAYAAQVAENLVKVDADLAAAGARP